MANIFFLTRTLASQPYRGGRIFFVTLTAVKCLMVEPTWSKTGSDFSLVVVNVCFVSATWWVFLLLLSLFALFAFCCCWGFGFLYTDNIVSTWDTWYLICLVWTVEWLRHRQSQLSLCERNYSQSRSVWLFTSSQSKPVRCGFEAN